MGNRSSVSFFGDGEESVVLFSHWDGMSLWDDATKYANDLCAELYAESLKSPGISYPLSRLEAQTVMVDFLRWFFQGREMRIDSNYYLGATQDDGDNSDNGHKTIDLQQIYDDVKAVHERITAMTTAAITTTPAASKSKKPKKTAAEWKASKDAAAKITGYGDVSPIWGKTDVQVFSSVDDLLKQVRLHMSANPEAAEDYLNEAQGLVTELQKREAYKRLAATL